MKILRTNKFINAIKEEFKSASSIISSLRKDPIIIFLSIAFLQTISYYYASRYFFRTQAKYYFNFGFVYDEIYEYAYWFLSEFFLYFIIPIILIKVFHKDRLKNFGLNFGDFKVGFLLSVIFALAMSIVIWFSSASPSFYNYYPLYKTSLISWENFVIFEILMMFYMIGWEFMWRGYVLFGLRKDFGYYAIFIQMIPFVILHNGKPVLETFGSIVGGIILGFFALRVGSFIYCALLHFYVIFFIDFICILRHKTQVYESSIKALIKLIEKING